MKFVGLAAVVCLILPLIHSLPHAAHDDCPQANTSIPLRILPLGDSITWGWQPAHQQDGTNGYRTQLLSDLLAANYHNVDFVGTQRSGSMLNNENEGHSGFTISQIHNVMGPGLALRPNVVLLHAGTNDLNRPESTAETWADAPKRLASVIDDVLKACPDAVVIVAKIIQATNVQTASNLKAFNEAIPGVVEERVKKGSKVTVVDQSVVGVDELVDGLHPTDAGYAHMGDVWFQGVKAASEEGLITPPV
ncbi:carbohydrate esterase family 3 protein [Cucurbitaria berberidis CBS 394.84]|uniref:Carbohydrate esterase family 3 protein n=1 Tax=Cucurbitaria berberidis CBS 394.84 TaxID=1168544 RepID=A0A9P4LEI5_9PLEO|nr:carbohydrate esterase family 3 protein [Cucurbitaria berberidis CBS 394.84]KAF1851963.1 carbohydrate esterase family 3 protein [Cucurbitaria berberidis CBS 394.84]